jgi:hypothetical protein
MVCLKQMEATVLGLKQLRSFIGKGSGQEMLDALIVEAEQTIERSSEGYCTKPNLCRLA